MKTGQGVLAEYCLVEKERLRRKPTDLEFEKAAAVPLATLTALGALVDTAGIKRENATGKKVFIVRRPLGWSRLGLDGVADSAFRAFRRMVEVVESVNLPSK